MEPLWPVESTIHEPHVPGSRGLHQRPSCAPPPPCHPRRAEGGLGWRWLCAAGLPPASPRLEPQEQTLPCPGPVPTAGCVRKHRGSPAWHQSHLQILQLLTAGPQALRVARSIPWARFVATQSLEPGSQWLWARGAGDGAHPCPRLCPLYPDLQQQITLSCTSGLR